MLTADQVEKNWEQYCNFLLRTGAHRKKEIEKMLEDLGQLISTAPASSRKDLHNCFVGGLVDHSLRVLKNAMKLNKAFNWELPSNSLIIAALFHDLGKGCSITIHDEPVEHYINNPSEWHRDKLGKLYEINRDENINHMSIQHKTLWLCQKYNIQLTQDEYLAILLNDGFVVDANKEYCLKEPLLATCILTADYISTMEEKTI